MTLLYNSVWANFSKYSRRKDASLHLEKKKKFGADLVLGLIPMKDEYFIYIAKLSNAISSYSSYEKLYVDSANFC